MKLSRLPKTTIRTKKRRGRGYGSGKGGHTVGRGSKGQKARSKVKLWFEGGQLPLVKRLPLQRGKGRFKPLKPQPIIVNLKYLNLLPSKTKVTLATLVKHRIISASEASTRGVKILGGGKLTKSLEICLPTSKSAAQAIKKAGGSVNLKPATKSKSVTKTKKTKPTKSKTTKAKPTKKPKPSQKSKKAKK